MAYRNTPHETTKQSPYYILHGREMDLPSIQSLRAKLSPHIRNTDHAPRLENFKSKLRTTYKLARDHGRISHATNKRYYDRNAKDREFAVGDSVYLYNPAIKAGVSAKFQEPWVGPWQVIERRFRLNYVIVDKGGKQLVVHINRLKTAYDPVEWQVAAKPKSRNESATETSVTTGGGRTPHNFNMSDCESRSTDWKLPAMASKSDSKSPNCRNSYAWAFLSRSAKQPQG